MTKEINNISLQNYKISKKLEPIDKHIKKTKYLLIGGASLCHKEITSMWEISVLSIIIDTIDITIRKL